MIRVSKLCFVSTSQVRTVVRIVLVLLSTTRGSQAYHLEGYSVRLAPRGRLTLTQPTGAWSASRFAKLAHWLAHLSKAA